MPQVGALVDTNPIGIVWGQSCIVDPFYFVGWNQPFLLQSFPLGDRRLRQRRQE